MTDRGKTWKWWRRRGGDDVMLVVRAVGPDLPSDDGEHQGVAKGVEIGVEHQLVGTRVAFRLQSLRRATEDGEMLHKRAHRAR